MKLRRTLAVVLCLLLLSLQSQALVHPLTHIGFGKAQDTGLASSTIDTPCVQCALLAGAGTAAVSDAAAFHADDVADVVLDRLHSQRTAAPPAWFRSRAPPSVLV